MNNIENEWPALTFHIILHDQAQANYIGANTPYKWHRLTLHKLQPIIYTYNFKFNDGIQCNAVYADVEY